MKVERNKEFGATERPARVAALGFVHHAHDVTANLGAQILQVI
jgi:hypothetical protein